MFNSLLILLPVIGARAVANAYDIDLVSREGAAEVLDKAKTRLEEELTTIGPRDDDRKLAYWQDRIIAELEAYNMSAVRGYLLSAPQMLGREIGEQVRVRAEAEIHGTEDERTIRAAMQKLPEPITSRIEATERFNPPSSPPLTAVTEPAPAELPEAETGVEVPAEAEAPPAPEPAEPVVLQANVRAEDERRFQILGSFH